MLPVTSTSHAPSSTSLGRWQVLLARPVVYLSAFFFLFLGYLVFTNPWYPAAKLHVSGRVEELPARLMIQWTSGHGLNGYEMYRYNLLPVPVAGESGHFTVRLTRTGGKHDAAGGTGVVLSSIYIDGERYSPGPEILGDEIVEESDGYVFQSISSKLNLSVKPKHHLRLEFRAYNFAGEVEVDVAGSVNRHLLYSPWDRTQWTRDSMVILDYWLVQPDGSFAVSMDMPRYRVNDLKLTAKKKLTDLDLRIVTEDGGEYRVGSAIPTDDGAVYQIAGLDAERSRLFHPQRLVFQVFFTLLTTWIIFGLLRYAGHFQGLADMFLRRGRFLFWGMLVTCMLLFAFWHISFWPGVTSTDSLKIWRAAHIPGMYLGDHPPLNVVVYQYLAQIFDNIAVVPIAQNFLTSLLVAWAFFSMYRWGVAARILAPFFLLIATSVPLGLYTIILWKDVPFALIIVFLGFRLADLAFRSRAGNVRLSRESWLVMGFLLLGLAGLRYNGALYLLVFPAMIFLLGIVKIRKRLVILFCCLLTIAGIFYSISQHLGLSASTFFSMQVKTYMGQVGKRFSIEFLRERGVQYLGVFDINQTATQWDHVGNCLYGRYDNNQLRRLRWNDVYPYLPIPRGEIQKKMAKTAYALYKKTYERPWVYLSWNPVYMLIVFPLLPLFYRRLPMSAAFSLFVFVEVIALVLIGIFNWRYYFFAHFASYFLLPLIIADLLRGRQKEEI